MRIAALQLRAVAGDVEANLDRIAAAAHDAYGAGASLLVAPELALTGYGAGEAIHSLAEPASGPQIDRLRQIASEAKIAIVAGFAERDGGNIYNSAAVVGPKAQSRVYRKSHLYGDYERSLFRPAPPSTATFDVGGMRLGVLICYDVEFPENVRRLALAGAKAIVVPTALPASNHARFIADRMISVRAFENQVFVAYANHCGSDRLFSYAGLSHVAAPDGGTLVLAGPRGEKLLIADMRPGDYAASADVNTYLRDLVQPPIPAQ